MLLSMPMTNLRLKMLPEVFCAIPSTISDVTSAAADNT
jgi:hypothetical protein